MEKKPSKKQVIKAKKLPTTVPTQTVWAVVPFSGAQYKIEVGGIYLTNRVKEAVGSSFKVNDVYLLNVGNDVKIGQPTVPGVSVDVEVLENLRGEKIDVFKYKAKSRYRRMMGHRQDLSKVKVIGINY